VGVNRFQTQETVSPPVFRVNKSVEQNQIRKLAEIRAKRDNQKVKKALARLEEASRGKDNVMPPILEAVHEHATLGEICDVLRRVFGVYDEKKGR
jgi:methylmalonyl-CoA mutase N-terminal domain/subunit